MKWRNKKRSFDTNFNMTKSLNLAVVLKLVFFCPLFIKNGNYFCENSFLCKWLLRSTMMETKSEEIVSEKNLHKLHKCLIKRRKKWKSQK